MKAKDIKHTVSWDFMKPEVISVEPRESIQDAVRLMRKYSVHHLLVMEQGHFKGLLEARDLPFTDHAPNAGPDATVASVMRGDVPMIYHSTDVGSALEMMANNRLTALPVVAKGHIVGILTETDLLKVLKAMLGKNTGLPILLDEGEALLANPLVQNVFKVLGLIGL